ncbi:MAG: transcriptional repressor [Actinobacteria bacterium]|nr:transcriptional repressor [Actinomycetota bacterium]
MKRVSQPKAPRRKSSRESQIIEVINQLDQFLGAQQIHKILSNEKSSIGLATIYRRLELLSAEGKIDAIISPTGERLYRRCGQIEGHHHHLICRLCGATEEIDLEAVESITARIARRYGYQDISHSLEVFGICASCQSIQTSSIKSVSKAKLR